MLTGKGPGAYVDNEALLSCLECFLKCTYSCIVLISLIKCSAKSTLFHIALCASQFRVLVVLLFSNISNKRCSPVCYLFGQKYCLLCFIVNLTRMKKNCNEIYDQYITHLQGGNIWQLYSFSISFSVKVMNFIHCIAAANNLAKIYIMHTHTNAYSPCGFTHRASTVRIKSLRPGERFGSGA